MKMTFVRRHIYRLCLLLVGGMFLLGAPAAAQVATGTVAGTVKDAQGGVIPGATVTLISQTRGTSLDTTANANGDFVLDAQGKRKTTPKLDAGDSGIYLRGNRKAQLNIWSQDLGSGEINGYRTDQKMPADVRKACIPLKKADKPFGEWNHFEITTRGERVTVVLNGDLVIDKARLPGVPATGPIGLQHHGDPVEFRNLWIKELSP